MGNFKFLNNKNIEKLPKTTGVYLFLDKKQTLYIGKAINIKNRVKNHFQQPSYRDNLFIRQVKKIGFIKTGSEIDALILEANLIKKYQPKYNVMWRDDKSYFWVCVAPNKNGLPFISVAHRPQKSQNPNSKIQINSKSQNPKLKTEFLGPFVEGAALKKTLKFLRRAFPYYTSPKHQKTKCTWCHLDLCPGPYLNLADYKKNIKKLTLILQGKKSAVLKSLKKEMKNEAKKQNFEKAGKIRDQVYALQQIMSHSHVISPGSGNSGFLPYGKKPHSPAQQILQKLIGMKNPISRIECYDVSNIQGKHATGSMVVARTEQPDKSSANFREPKLVLDKNQYRKFRIKIDGKPNDIAMLKEIFQRRFNHPEWAYPDAILIDGGKAQLNAAINVKNKNLKLKKIKVLSIAKGRQELFLENKKNSIPLKSLPKQARNFILQLDQEAHRFAITYHKKLRKINLIK